MNFEPQKFFVGLMDFFSILMPGAVLAYLGRGWAEYLLLAPCKSFSFGESEAWVVFFFAAYLLGHFAFLLGNLLDKWPYDPLRKRTYWGTIERLADRKNIFRKRSLWAVTFFFFGKNPDKAVMQAARIKARSLATLSAENAVNAFQWSKIYLSKFHPEGLANVERFEASSKFFRSFTVVLFILFIGYLLEREKLLALLCFGAIFIALWRYIEQRFKATQQAYWEVITLEGIKEPVSVAAEHNTARNKVSRAGGVVYRRHGNKIEYLLIQSSDRKTWVLPKGKIEAGETDCQAAVREVQEETGYWAKIDKWIQDNEIKVDSVSQTIRFFLMELAEKNDEEEEKKRFEEKRQRNWRDISKIDQDWQAGLMFVETKDTVLKAAELIKKT